MTEEENSCYSPCCTSWSADFGFYFPRVDGDKTFHCKHDHQPRRGIVCSVVKNVPHAAPWIVTPKRLLLVVLNRKFKNHNEDQNKVISHRHGHQVEVAGLGEHAVPPQDDQEGDGVC